MREKYPHTVTYEYSELLPENAAGVRQSSGQTTRDIKGYFNQNNDAYNSEGITLTGNEYSFTCNLNEVIETGNYILFEGNRYHIKNESGHDGLTLDSNPSSTKGRKKSHKRLTLIKIK